LSTSSLTVAQDKDDGDDNEYAEENGDPLALISPMALLLLVLVING
jgi:hypothetical protein